MIEHGGDWCERLPIQRCGRGVGIQRAGRLFDQSLVDFCQRDRANARDNRFKVKAFAASLEVAHGCTDERSRHLRSKDTTLDDLPLALRANRFSGLLVSNSCALAYCDASDGAVHIPVWAATSSLELEGHGRASYKDLISEWVNNLRPPSTR